MQHPIKQSKYWQPVYQMVKNPSYGSPFYHLHMWVGNVFSVMSVCLSVQAITFEPLDTETSFLVCRYIFTISRSSLSTKVIGSRSRSFEKNDNFTYFNTLIFSVWLQAKFIHQTEGHIKVKYLHPFKFYVVRTLCKWVVCIRLNAFSFKKKFGGHKSF